MIFLSERSVPPTDRKHSISSNRYITMPTFKTINDLHADFQNHIAEMDRIFSVSDGFITINASYPYHIELSRIPDHLALLEWIDHLAGKDWMSPELIREFIRRVCDEKNWTLHRNL